MNAIADAIESLQRAECWRDLTATAEWRTLATTLGDLDRLTPANAYRVADVSQMLTSIEPHLNNLYNQTIAWKENVTGSLPVVVVVQLQTALYTTLRHYQAAVAAAAKKSATTMVAPNFLDDMRKLIRDAMDQYSTTYSEKCRTSVVLQWLRGAVNSIVNIGRVVGTFFQKAAMVTLTVAEKAGAMVVAGVSSFPDLLKLGGMAVVGWLAYAFAREFMTTGRMGLPSEIRRRLPPL